MNRQIRYRYLHWGPFVSHYSLLEEEVKQFKSLKSGDDNRVNLAGHLKDEKVLNKDEVWKILSPYINSYVQGFHEFSYKSLPGSFELASSWINRQKKNEFNPPHTHDGDLSFVLYTEIPKGLKKESQSSVSNSPGPGCIIFDFNMPGMSTNNHLFLSSHSFLPEVGDMFIFPASLPHWVFPFKETEGERVSISGNVVFKK